MTMPRTRLYEGRWALVTGASSGIGEAFARALAENGADLILVARREARLAALAKALKTDHGARTMAIPADLTDPDAPGRVAAAALDAGRPIDILVNNAGWGLPGQYTDNDWPAYRDYLQLMVASYAHFARLVLPGMREREYGRIIQVASVAGLLPGSAGHTLYGGAKAFLVGFSQSLAAESRGRGVKVSALCPGLTHTEFHDVNGARGRVSMLPRFAFMTPEAVARAGLAAVERGRVVVVPGRINQAVAFAARVLPRAWAGALMESQSRRVRVGNAQRPAAPLSDQS